MKKEVSEALAKAFFEKRREKKKDNNSHLFFLLLACVAVIFVLSIVAFSSKAFQRMPFLRQTLELGTHDGPYKLKFDFTLSGAATQSLNVEIPEVELSDFKVLKFKARLLDPKQFLGQLKIGLVNTRQENSYLYIGDVDKNWKVFTVSLIKFNSIHDWSNLSRISFIVEKWNTKIATGEVLVDQIEFVK